MALTFPRHVHKRGGVYRVCPDEDTYQVAKADGWVDHPPVEWGQPGEYHEWDGSSQTDELMDVPPEPADVPEAPTPKKRGRPRKGDQS